MKPKASERMRQPCTGGSEEAVAAAVVVTVMVEVFVAYLLVAWKDAGLNAHAAPAGRPEHARLIVPLNPVDQETETDALPELPGADTTTVDCAFPIDARNPAWIVNGVGPALLLGLKLASPL